MIDEVAVRLLNRKQIKGGIKMAKKNLFILMSVCLCSVWLVLGLEAAAQDAPKSIKVSAVVSETGKFAALANHICRQS